MVQKVWAIGEEVLAADLNAYVQQQVVAVFATVAARDSGWAAPPNGARCVTLDTDTEWARVGGVWVVARGQQVAYAEVTASQGSIGATVVDLTGLSVTFTAAGSGRRYRIYGECSMQSTVAGDLGRLDITDSSGATTYQAAQYSLGGSANRCSGTTIEVLGAGPQTFKLRAVRSGGTGTVTMNASTVSPAFISVDAI